MAAVPPAGASESVAAVMTGPGDTSILKYMSLSTRATMALMDAIIPPSSSGEVVGT